MLTGQSLKNKESFQSQEIDASEEVMSEEVMPEEVMSNEVSSEVMSEPEETKTTKTTKTTNNIVTKLPETSIPGEIIMIEKDIGIIIMTNDYPIQIKKAQLEGKVATDSYTLSVQTNLKIRDIFGN